MKSDSRDKYNALLYLYDNFLPANMCRRRALRAIYRIWDLEDGACTSFGLSR